MNAAAANVPNIQDIHLQDNWIVAPVVAGSIPVIHPKNPSKGSARRGWKCTEYVEAGTRKVHGLRFASVRAVAR